jgi:SAM-dependent methyltransferase
MREYHAQAIVDSYTESSEISRVDRTSDAAIMFQIERWFIERYLPDSGTVIDVGGGPGRFAVEIAKLGRGVVLTDITPKHIEQAKQLAEQEGVADKIIEYRVMDIRDLSAFGDGAFSMAVCYGMLNYTLDRDIHVLSELGRIVQLGGPILVSAMGLYGAVWYVWAQGRLADPSYRERERDPRDRDQCLPQAPPQVLHSRCAARRHAGCGRVPRPGDRQGPAGPGGLGLRDRDGEKAVYRAGSGGRGTTHHPCGRQRLRRHLCKRYGSNAQLHHQGSVIAYSTVHQVGGGSDCR